MGVSENSVPPNPLGYHHFPCIAMLGCPDTSIIRLWMKRTDAPSVHKDIARFHLLRFTPNVRDLAIWSAIQTPMSTYNALCNEALLLFEP
jgi:hypothetical protein